MCVCVFFAFKVLCFRVQVLKGWGSFKARGFDGF